MAVQVHRSVYIQRVRRQRQFDVVLQREALQLRPLQLDVRVLERYPVEPAAVAVEPDALSPAPVEHHLMRARRVEAADPSVHLAEIPAYKHRPCRQVGRGAALAAHRQEVPSYMHLGAVIRHVQICRRCFEHLLPFRQDRALSHLVVVLSYDELPELRVDIP